MARRRAAPVTPEPEAPKPAATRGRRPAAEPEKPITPLPPPRTAGVGQPAIAPQGGFIQSVDSVERDAQALQLRAAAWTYQAISDHLQYGSASNAHKAVERAVRLKQGESAEVVRTRIRETIDVMIGKALQVLHSPHLVYQGGEVLRDEHGQPVIDPRPTLDAVRTLAPVLERYAKLEGVDAPERSEIEITSLPPEIAAWIAEKGKTK